ncbi:ASCH domain-containing protein [Klebsiella pneumoniae]|uniref:morphogenetic protein n=1 Tax=Klebsiella pneumoniae TaxID=573 RepID=UPI000E2E0BEC|nr:morphogenetic protein [Klebsiella pneumoniae]MBD7769173.1 morphogenetic protein [Klebsiella pneumoniae]SVW65776.1 morphogenetic protein [Klebsiella pneumoniae]
MKERGMIFNAEMVQALLDGRKTQTRRIIKPQPEATLSGSLSGKWLSRPLNGLLLPKIEDIAIHCPFGVVGDRIWVREAYRFPASLDDVSPTGVGEMAVATGYRKPWAPTFYEFTGTFSDGWKGFETPPKVSGAGKLRPSIHMPRWASRILLEITEVRVERLDAISEEDALAEGMQGVICPCCKGDSEYSTSQYDAETLAVIDEIPCRACESNRSKFFTLWDSIYGYGQHCFGEWVWVIEFKRVEGGAA